MKKYNFINKKIFLFIALTLPFGLCGCNTMEGAGADIQQAGRALEKSAECHKECPPACPQCGHKHCRHKR